MSQGKVSLLGKTPTKAEVESLASCLAQTNPPVLAIDRLPEVYPPAERIRSVASGVLGARLSSNELDMLLWFRPDHF